MMKKNINNILNNSLSEIFQGKKVLVTGHTGFKGSWLAIWLNLIGAKVFGVSKGVPSEPNNFQCCGLIDHINHIDQDILSLEGLKKNIEEIQPDFIFILLLKHLCRNHLMNH